MLPGQINDSKTPRGSPGHLRLKDESLSSPSRLKPVDGLSSKKAKKWCPAVALGIHSTSIIKATQLHFTVAKEV